jgi:hypothetical protein
MVKAKGQTMKCQKCDNHASQHITEMVDGAPVEYHVCEEHGNDLSSIKGLQPGTSSLTSVFSDPDLRAALADQDARNKVSAWVLPSLCLALVDERAEVRIHAAFRLMSLGKDAESVLDALRDALDDEDERVQKIAKAAIEHIQEGGESLFGCF